MTRVVFVTVGVLLLVGLWVFRPGVPPPPVQVTGDYRSGTVETVSKGCGAQIEATNNPRCQVLTVQVVDMVVQVTDYSGVPLRAGDDVTLSRSQRSDGVVVWQFVDRDRTSVLWVFAAVFAVAVAALGRWRGVTALVGLGLSFGLLVWWVIPGLLSGRDPMAVAVVASGVVAYVTVVVSHGFGPVAQAATLSTVVALAVCWIATVVFTTMAGFTGIDETIPVSWAVTADLRGLLAAGMVIGAVGAVDDLTVSQCSMVAEMREASPTRSTRMLIRSAMIVGRDHVGAAVNTLAFAYAGAALPLLLAVALTNQPFGVTASSEAVAAEVVRMLVGGIALVLAVPAATWIAAYAIRRPEPVTD